MAAKNAGQKLSSKDMAVEEFSNIFASEFNNSDIHDRVLCFQIIENDEFDNKDDSEDALQSQYIKSDETSFWSFRRSAQADDKDEDMHVEHIMNTSNASETLELTKKGEEALGEKQGQETTTEVENMTGDNENKSTVSKLFVHSQWLAVQSPYFKALFFSGMKETYSKEVVMKIYEHELQAHLALIEAMYKTDVLNDKDYRLLVQVLVLAHKYDVPHVIKKCKCVLLSTTPSLEMCEYILQEIEPLFDTADVCDMLEKFLVEEFTPIDKTWTMEKFATLSEAALRLLLGSDSLATQSENTIFVALMKWVRLNVSWFERQECDLLDVVRFEFIPVDFLYDVVKNHVVARRMPGFNKYLQKGLAYPGFSEIRREQLEPKPKKRPFVADAGPTYSWIIDEELKEKLMKSPGVSLCSDVFWYQGYSMRLRLGYAEGLTKCSFSLTVFGLSGKACLYMSYKTESNFFVRRILHTEKRLFTASSSTWGYESLECNKARRRKGYTIDVWIQTD